VQFIDKTLSISGFNIFC